MLKKIGFVLFKLICTIGLFGTFLSLTLPMILFIKNFLMPGSVDVYGYFLLGLPFVVIAWPYGIVIANKSGESKYGIRFWGAIKNVPKWMIFVLWVILPLVALGSAIPPHIGMGGIIPLFDYIAFLIYLSALLEKRN